VSNREGFDRRLCCAVFCRCVINGHSTPVLQYRHAWAALTICVTK
jgi:hypothetical protein